MKTLSIPSIPEETDIEYTLRAAAAFIRAFASDKPVCIADYDEEVTGEILAEICQNNAEELAKERLVTAKSMRFEGKIIQAGHDSDNPFSSEIKPTVTIVTSQRELKDCETIPFYQSANILIVPIRI